MSSVIRDGYNSWEQQKPVNEVGWAGVQWQLKDTALSFKSGGAWLSCVAQKMTARPAWGTGCYGQTMNPGTQRQKLMTDCMVANIP